MCTNNYKLENKHRLHHVPAQKVDYCTTLYNNSYHNLNSVEPTLQFNSLLIRDLTADLSLNCNVGSTELRLW